MVEREREREKTKPLRRGNLLHAMISYFYSRRHRTFSLHEIKKIVFISSCSLFQSDSCEYELLECVVVESLE